LVKSPSPQISPYETKDEEFSSHQFIAEWIRYLPSGLTGLDIGAATGIFGSLVKDSGLIIDGIEPVLSWAELAAPFYRHMFTESIETIAMEKISGYDFIILGDILEHLPDPQRILSRLINLQPESCVYLISVPNIANIWIRINLLLGRFDYQERGILDKTHLRFFTSKTFFSMLDSVGLDVIERKITPIPLFLVNNFFRQSFGKFLYKALFKITVLLPNLLGYQFVVKAIKHKIDKDQ
jgi:hypothetical protein